ncbi:MAG TPA: histidinol-phosphatase HisJ family protein [Phycisphaerae bacterium]|nr:histidinol-phosphatase HisJ family protein [Phycisphaerae bacterium]
MSLLYDQHVHSRLSVDCRSDPARNVQRAIELGLAGVTFNEHYDCHPSERDVCIYDYELISQTIENLRAEYGGRIFIGHGIEVCYQPAWMEEALRHIASHRFDVVMLSVHWFEGRALHERGHWDGVDPARATRAYLEGVLEAVRFVLGLARRGLRPFDVLGHLDLVKRYTQRYFGVHDVRSCRDVVERILATSLEAELILELNTSTMRQGVDEPTPAEWAVRRYAEMGGKCMLLGSDAHRSEDVGANLGRASEMLAAAGIAGQAVFQNRQRCDLPL